MNYMNAYKWIVNNIELYCDVVRRYKSCSLPNIEPLYLSWMITKLAPSGTIVVLAEISVFEWRINGVVRHGRVLS